MNILILSWRGPGHPNEGGAEIVTHEHAKAWVKAGHNVTLFTSSYIGCKKGESIDGVEIIRSGRQVFGVQISAFFWYRFGKHRKFDIIVDEFHGIPFFTPLYVKTKILGFIHEVALEVWKVNEFPKPYNIIPAYLGPIIEPLIFKLYKKIDFLTVSSSTKEDLIGFGIKKNKITVISNGISRSRKKYLGKREKVVIYLGALSHDKGIEDALKTFSEIKRKDEDWKFWVVGKSSPIFVLTLKNFCRKLNIYKETSFFGFVSDQKKFELLSKAFVMINPSIYEGWGLVNVEANSVGTPVVAYKVKGIIDSVKEGYSGILCDKGDYRQLAIVIIKLWQNKNLYEKLSQQSEKWSRKFTWEQSTKESISLIESL